MALNAEEDLKQVHYFLSGGTSSTGPCGFVGWVIGSKLDFMYSFALVS